MTGPEHYATAEEHLAAARKSGDHPKDELVHLAYAQVHATLAHAAATASGFVRLEDNREWFKVAGFKAGGVTA